MRWLLDLRGRFLSPTFPRDQLAPLPRWGAVLRLAKAGSLNQEAKDALERGFIHESFLPFSLSSADEVQQPPLLSVWSRRLTSPRQAWLIRGANAAVDYVFSLPIRKLRHVAVSDAEPARCLEVVWDRYQDQLLDEVRPLVSTWSLRGHAGVQGLPGKKDNRVNKQARRRIRSQLADLAKKRGRWLRPCEVSLDGPHWFEATLLAMIDLISQR